MANKYTNRDLWEYDFKESDNYKSANQNRLNAERAVADYGPFQYLRQQDYDNAINAKLNQGKFSYDLNADALYQQYKENYISQGKQAMMDAMGQAAAMTGGYGNSYAATVGNQTYQGYLTNLNNMIPQLQQMALDRYNAESNRLSENLSVLQADRANALSEHELGYNKLIADRDYYANNADSIYNRDLSLYNSKFNANNDAYWNEYNAGYKAEQDAIANALAQKQYQLQADAQKIAELQAGVKRDSKGNIVSVASVDDEEEFSRYTYAGVNEENGKSIFYKDGEKYEFDRGINPYGVGSNPDAANGTFANGYQPDNVGGKKLSKTGEKKLVNGVEQNIWQTKNGNKYYWDGTKGKYVELSVDDATQNIKKFIDNLTPESQHDAIARNMYGSYSDYVDKMTDEALEKGKLSEEEAKYVIRTLL